MIFDFSYDIYKYLQKADFAIARAGASTLWELVAIGLPALFIPYPYAAANHQYYNAKFLVDKNLAMLVTEDNLNKFDINDIFSINLEEISTNLTKMINKNGAKKIIDYILDKTS